METLLFESETIRKGPPYLALIVPYRDRPAHLVEFAPHMESFLKDIEFRLMLIEQADNKPFNRGKLLNIGFTLAREEAIWMCFHDVDMLPKDDSCDYSLPQHTTHLAGRAEQFGYKMPYPEYLGGVLLTTRTDFERANGFSNEYWGWGQEDDDLFIRFLLSGVRICRKPGLYRSLAHEPGQLSAGNINRLIESLSFAARNVNDSILVARIRQVIGVAERRASSLPGGRRYAYAKSAGDYQSEGLSTLRYDLLSRKPLRESVQFSAGISPYHELITVRL
jgi:hypothetical protein